VTRTAHLQIDGMLSVHAVRAVYTAFAGVPGIRSAEVTLGGATVEHDGTVTREMLAEAIEFAGFTLAAWREERRLPTL
jgi:copper chaperone CopZ